LRRRISIRPPMSNGDMRRLLTSGIVRINDLNSGGAATARTNRDVSGHLLRKREIPGFTITEDRYDSAYALPKHHHRKSFLTFVLEGSYVERYQGSSSICGPGMLRFLPAGEVHENHFQSGLRCLHVEIEDYVLERLREQAPVLERPAEISGVASTW